MLRAIFFALLLSACAHQQAATPYPPEQPPEAVPASIDSVLARAEEENKLALLVLGANWCHDSVAFAEMIEEPELNAWLSEHYVIGLFNLGYVDQVGPYLDPWGVPAVYGTPTVLIVDPTSRQLLNLDRHWYWRNAYQQTADEARDYFGDYLTAPAATPVSDNLAQALARIDAFEKTEAQRVRAAYVALAPAMLAYDEGKPPADFEEKWGSLAKMRGKLTKDMTALRESAREQDARGITPVQLEFPEYSLVTY